MSTAGTIAPPPTRVWHLEGIGDEANVRRHVIAGHPFQVGRDHQASLWLPHPSISKLHAEFGLDAEQLTLRDLGSTNGTFVNAERLHDRALLQPGDLVHFAHIGFRVGVWVREDTEAATIEPLQSALLLETAERRRAEVAHWNSEATCAGWWTRCSTVSS